MEIIKYPTLSLVTLVVSYYEKFNTNLIFVMIGVSYYRIYKFQHI